MSKEHAYAYEAGYRDGSIHYELEHCPACKNIADLQEALADNAKLQEQSERLFDKTLELATENSKLREDLEFERSENGWAREFLNRMGQKCGTKDCPSLVAYVAKLEADNAKLRELVRDLWEACPVDGYYCIYHCKHYDKESESHCKLEDRMRELEVGA